MKKICATLGVASILLLTTTSCKKLVTALLPAFDVEVPAIQITIPPVPIVTANEIPLGSYTVQFNLDSIIRARTAGVFNINDVKSLKVKEIGLNVTNADNLNNLSNFQSARLSLFSNSNRSEVNIANITFPDNNASSLTVQTPDSPDLLSYLNGTELTYNLAGKSRRPTFKSLNMVVAVTVRVE